MIKTFNIFILLVSIIICCKPKDNKEKAFDASPKEMKKVPYPLVGTWIYKNESSFTLFEIIDSMQVNCFMYSDAEIKLKKPVPDRYFYFRSDGKIKNFRNPFFSIQTDKFRFDFKIIGDTLIEIEKNETGEGIRLIRMYPEEEKAFRYYYSHDIKGIIQGVSRGDSGTLFITKRVLKNPLKDKTEKFENYMFQYHFSDLENTFENYKTLNDLASSGDSIFKPAFSDTLLLLKSKTKEYIKIAFKKK